MLSNMQSKYKIDKLLKQKFWIVMIAMGNNYVKRESLCIVLATFKISVTSHSYLEIKVYIFINKFRANCIFLYPLTV